MGTNNIKNTTTLWKAVVGEISIVEPMIRSFISNTELIEVSEHEIEISCENPYSKTNLEAKYQEMIEDAINKITERDYKVSFSNKKQANIQETTQLPINVQKEDLGPLFTEQKSKDEVDQEKRRKANISPKFTFTNFITGSNNNLAYAIATAIAERPGEQYNPVFFYSGVGLGKTHLIQAIGNRIIETKPGMKVLYTTGEQFTNELIESIQSGRRGKYASNEFRKKYRNADVLLIDDVQFIIGRETTQEEFFHTFNTLYMAQKQIVITSDRPPKEFDKLEDRITSRFASGIIADIQPPNIEMRTAILRNLRDKNGDNISNQIIDIIAEKVDSNVRELEGAYMQVRTYTLATGADLTEDTVLGVLGHAVRENHRIPVNMNQILKHVCTYYAVKSKDVKGKRRTKELVIPRQVAMYLIKEITDTPFMTIGEFLGGRDHTTVMHGVDKVGDELTKTPKLKQDVVNIKQMLYRA